MTMPFSLAEELKIVACYQGAANAVACDVVSMKNFAKGWFIVYHSGANDTDLVLTVKIATDVAAGTNATIGTACRIWKDVDAGTSSDVLAADTAATGYTIDPATENGVILVFEIDPATFTSGYDCVYLGDSGGHASNVCSILFVGVPRYAGSSLPAAITD